MALTSVLQQLLGDFLVRSSDERITVSSIIGKDKVIGLYFSAHWCPPCRAFTPKLADFYCDFKSSERAANFELVYVSSDKDEETFWEYFGIMPWLALPYTDRSKKARLSKKFHVHGIPTLVLLDGHSGKVITNDGRRSLTDDPKGSLFPWRQKQLKDLIQGPLLLSKGDKIDSESALNNKITGLYFSAHWCPPCKAFTPELARTYHKLRSSGKNFEIVFVSHDRSDESFTQYFEMMPWLAIPYGDERTAQLDRFFGIEGIPTLIMMDENGKVITKNGRDLINDDREGDDFPWRPKALTELTERFASDINENSCLVLFTDGEDDTVAKAKDALQNCADKEYSKGENQELFFFYGADDELCDALRDFTKLDDRLPLLVIFDIPEQQMYINPAKEITRDTVQSFVIDYNTGTLQATLIRP